MGLIGMRLSSMTTLLEIWTCTMRKRTWTPSIPYSRCYASDSDWEGPEDEVDEDGFTMEEAEVHKKVLGRDPRISLFCDISLAKEAKVDGGKGIVLGAKPTS